MEAEDRDRLVRIEGKVDTLVDRGADHETRLRSAEQKIWAGGGAFGIMSALLGAILYKWH